jgi:hypothetical protein
MGPSSRVVLTLRSRFVPTLRYCIMTSGVSQPECRGRWRYVARNSAGQGLEDIGGTRSVAIIVSLGDLISCMLISLIYCCTR